MAPHQCRLSPLALVSVLLLGSWSAPPAPAADLPSGGPPAPSAGTPRLPGAAARLEGPEPLVLSTPGAAPAPPAGGRSVPEPASRETLRGRGAAAASGAGQGPETVPPSASPVQDPVELVLDRRRRLLTVLEDGRTLHRYPVAVGMPGWETPVGRFAVIEMTADPAWEHPASGKVFPPGPSNPLGSRWIGFHRDCRGRRGFNGSEQLEVKGCVTAGFHGTPNRASIGRAASHGCVRLYDEHARQLFDLVRVGTPVTVLP